MAAHYKLKKSSNGQFRFSLHSANGENILTSEGYASREGAENGIKSVQTNSPDQNRFERKVSASEAKQPYFVLKARNGEIIGTSEMYSSTGARDGGIESVIKHGSTTEIKDETQEHNL